MRLLRRVCVLAVGLVGLGFTMGLAKVASAQADYPFRDPRLADDVRIADLLHRLTLEEKLQDRKSVV